jgi:DNA modification methylase
MSNDQTHLPFIKEPKSKRIKPEKKDSGFISSVWTFEGNGGSQLYRYYGTLPRQLIERIFTLYAKNANTRVFDPFLGLGTTLDVAADFGIEGQGFDVNPLACLASETRLYTSRDLPFLQAADALERDFKKRGMNAANNISEILMSDKYAYARKWFREENLYSILGLLICISGIKDLSTQRLFFVIASQLVREVANVDTRCTHHLVTKRKDFIPAICLFEQKLATAINTLRNKPADSNRISVMQGSAIDLLPQDKADLIIIHPPYLGVIHYHLIHRLATDLLDVVKSAHAPISLSKYDFSYARIKEGDVSTDSSKPYNKFIQNIAASCSKATAANGRCVVIIGDQRNKGHLRHPFTDFIAAFEQHGFLLEEIFVWLLENNGGMHILRRGHFIDHNYILVLHKVAEAC